MKPSGQEESWDDSADFEELLDTLPEGFLDQLYLDADAEKLLRAVFGKVD